MLPILQLGGERDERFPGVILLDSGDGWKQTAEDMRERWYIRDWEVMDVDGEPHWSCDSAFAIEKSVIERLAVYAPEPEVK